MLDEVGSLIVSTKNVVLDQNYSKMIPKAAPGAYALVTVKDTGAGIGSHILDRIFDPFFTTKDVGKGTGLGLSTVRGIVENHGGFLNVSSELAKGTVFEVYLPPLLDPTVALPSLSAVKGNFLFGNGELILFVDDEAEIRTIAQRLLESSGYQVVVASNGKEAFDVYVRLSNQIKVVITDYMMPYMDGIALARALQKISPKVKIVASSGDLQDAKLAQLAVLNPSAILLKPYTRNTLLITLRGVLFPGSNSNITVNHD